MLRMLIVGFGNPLRSDDGLGWRLAKELGHEFASDDIRVIAVHQLTPELAHTASNARRVLFIDAASEGEPGTVVCKQITAATPSTCTSHELSPAAILKLADELYGRSPTACLLTIAGASFEIGETLSAPVAAALPALMDQIRKWINSDEKKAAGGG